MTYLAYPFFKNFFFPTTAKQINPAPSKSIVAGSGISENPKGAENAGITKITANATKNIPAKNSFFIPPLADLHVCPETKKMDRSGIDPHQFGEQNKCQKNNIRYSISYLNYFLLY